MQVRPGTQANQAVIKPDTFDAPIEATGLSAEVLAGLFHGTASARAHWKPGLQVTARLAGQSELPDSKLHEQNLEDGRAMLHSGQPGTVMVETGHQLSEELLQPQSLYLLLAQQWARAGLMLVHGAVFEFEGHGVLALGDRGAGKSVLTMAALAAGAKVISDDWVMLGSDADGTVRAERLREFLMLRHGLACDRLLAALPDLRPTALRNRPKSVVRMEEQPAELQAHFTTTCRIDRFWLLQRRRTGRMPHSERIPATSADALSAVIRATMPLFFSRTFEHEAKRLRATAGRLATQIGASQVRTGTDILENPSSCLNYLL